jgi:nicotinamide-nucleotide amidase
VTGGLGPTADDITRDAIANATGCPLERHPDIEDNLRERFARWGYQRMSENNLRQAQIPETATVLENPVGTAPGFVSYDRRHGRDGKVIAMPGVPREMKRMMADLVLPFLQELTGGVGIIRRRILRTVGIGESSLDADLGHLMDSANPTMGLAAHLGQADVRIAARAESADEAEELLDKMEEKVRAVIGSYIYSTTPEEAVESVLARLLHEADASVALLETVTKGAIADRMNKGVSPENPVRILQADAEASTLRKLLDQPPAGEVAHELALQLRRECNVSHGLAVITSGQPDETFHSNQGGETWIGCAGPDRTEVARFPFGGADRLTNAWVGNRAMDLLRRILLDLEV